MGGARPLSELLLRTSTSYAATPLWQRSSPLCLARRTISTGTPARAAQPQLKDDAPRDALSEFDNAPQPARPARPARTARPPPRSTPSRSPTDVAEGPVGFRTRRNNASNEDVSSHIDSLLGFGRRQARQPPKQPTSADEFSAGYQTFGNLAPRGNLPQKKTLDFDALNMPMPVGGIDSAPNVPAPFLSDDEITYPRLGPVAGRTVSLDNAKGRDIVRGINMLGTLCARNRVKADFNKQKFHERAGLKRKRLHSERWRRKFKLEFDHTCRRVQELTRKGW